MRSMNFMKATDLDALARRLVDEAERETHHEWLDKLDRQVREAEDEGAYEPAHWTEEDAEQLRVELATAQLNAAWGGEED